jgi:hypothetical protein
LRRTGKAKIRATWGPTEEEETTTEVFVMSDQVEYDTYYLEAPYVGYSLSTPQLYVTTNIGYQVFRNSFTQPRDLAGSQVCAVLQNSFSAGMYLNGAGDFPITTNQFDLGNMEFTLVDSNYHPLKLFSPMFVIMKIEPAADAAQDIKQFKGKLPKDAPTRQQLQQQQAENDKKAKDEQKKQIVIDALAQVAEKLLPPTQQNPGASQQPPQPQSQPQLPNINDAPSVEPSVRDAAPAPSLSKLFYDQMGILRDRKDVVDLMNSDLPDHDKLERLHDIKRQEEIDEANWAQAPENILARPK